MANQHFVQVVDSESIVQIINISQIVRASQNAPGQGGKHGWQVVLTADKSVTLNESEAEKLFKRMPGLPTTAGAV